MPDPFVVGPTGLPRFRYEDWRSRVVSIWRTHYGPDADTRPETPDGLVIDAITLELTQVGDAVQDVWANSFFRTADDLALALLLDVFGRAYLGATATAVDAVWYGQAGTLVHDGVGTGPTASVLSDGDTNGDRYEVVSGAAGTGTVPAVADDGALVIVRVNAATDGNTYGIRIDATESTYVAAPTDDVVDVADGLAAALLADNPTFTFDVLGTDPSGQALLLIGGKGTEPVLVGASTTAPAELDVFPGVLLTMRNELTGPLLVLTGSLVVIETPILNIEGVVNPLDGTLGRNRETAAELRVRHYDQLFSQGTGTPPAIRAAVLDQLPNPLVKFARVDENPSASAVAGPPPLPPHSFQLTIVGDATDQQVGDVLLFQKPAGIEPVGSIEVVVTDPSGVDRRIYFERGTELYLWLDIDVTAGEGFPTVGDPETAITTAIVQGLGQTLELGQDLYLPTVVGLVAAAVAGVSAVAAETDATATPAGPPVFSATNVTVGPTEVLIVDSSRITVTIV